MGINDILIVFGFFIVGAVSGFFLRKSVSSMIFVVILFAAFKMLELLGIKSSWADIQDFFNAISMLWQAVYDIFKNFLEKGNALSIALFITGIIAGTLLKFKRAKKETD